MAEQLVDVTELRSVLNLDGNPLYEVEVYERVCDAASELLHPYLAEREGGYADVAPVREAALAIAVDLWQHRVAPGGQMQAADFTPSPYRLGRSMLGKVSGLLGPYMDVEGQVG